MKILSIHEILPWMLDLDLNEYDVITFDDGLYSQYLHHKHFLKFNKPLIFFISTNIVCMSEQNTDIIDCEQAHELFFTKQDTSYYMTWEQIKELNNQTNCFIGGHSHNHNKYTNYNIRDLYFELKQDTELMIETFFKNEININKFCFPYNKEYPLYKHILKDYGIEQFYSNERINIEELK